MAGYKAVPGRPRAEGLRLASVFATGRCGSEALITGSIRLMCEYFYPAEGLKKEVEINGGNDEENEKKRKE